MRQQSLKRALPPPELDPYFKEAVSNLRLAIDRNPKIPSFYYKIGSAYINLNQLASQRMVAARKKGDLLEAGRQEAIGDENLDKGIEAYENLAALSPDYAEIHYNLGIVYSLAAERARRRFERSHDPTLKKEAEDYDHRAVRHVLRMVQLSNKSEVALLAGLTLLDIGKNNPRYRELATGFLNYAASGDLKVLAQARSRLDALLR